MATTTLNTDFMLVVYTTIFLTLVASPVFVVYKFVVWCWTYTREKKAARFLSWFGNHDNDLVDSLTEVGAVDHEGAATARGDGIRGWTRVRRSAVTEIAFSLADEAYLQFGRRDRSKANDLVTRKFLRDLLSKYDSLRAKDKSRIIEIALSLSYVPPSEFEDMTVLESSRAYRSAVPTAAYSTQ
jgi:hypothetical protein